MNINTFLVDTIFCWKGIFLKSICIKTNNQELKNYLLKKFDSLNLDSVYFSCLKFKLYDNVIIHYTGKNIDLFLQNVSSILSNSIVELFEKSIIYKMLCNNYFYFSHLELKQIFKICNEELEAENDFLKLNTLKYAFYQYFLDNKCLVYEGFIYFRLGEYLKYLDSFIDIAVNKFIVDREYLQFVDVIKSYINSKPADINLIHLIYKGNNSILLDEYKKVIELSDDSLNNPYISDISFSSNDYALNTLLTIIPRKLIIHTLEENDEFINTLKLIFEKRVEICKE